jgi:transposase
MSAYERITMSLREVDRLKVIQAVTEGFLTPTRAAQRLQLSTRQVHRLVQRYRDAGVSGLTSRKRGQPSNHQLRPGLEQRAAALIRQHYQDFGPTLAAEKLVECHGLRLAKETVRRIMMDAGLWTPRRQRPPKVYQPRNRRACLGELIQIDGSDHRWFEDRAPACTLLA